MEKMLRVILIPAAMLSLAACSGVNSTLRYGRSGEPEYFIECNEVPMARCYDKALALCPQGYFLIEESQKPTGSRSGTVWGRVTHVGAAAHGTEIGWKNQVVVHCKDVPVAASAAAPASSSPTGR
jgi:hypothetical protein